MAAKPRRLVSYRVSLAVIIPLLVIATGALVTGVAYAVAANKRVWTDPYVFFDTGVPGITCAAPVVAADGTLRGVVSVDFDLNSLGEFVATLHPSEHARVFIYTESGAMLAHPTVHVVAGEYKRGEGKLVTADEVGAGQRDVQARGRRARDHARDRHRRGQGQAALGRGCRAVCADRRRARGGAAPEVREIQGGGATRGWAGTYVMTEK